MASARAAGFSSSTFRNSLIISRGGIVSNVCCAYQGLLPDLFREGQGVVAEGALDPAGTFRADSVLAKHDETYMPKDVADALKKQGHWKDDYEKKLGTAPQGRAQ
jgi:cytochrome c-type biogenesis protein CcmE